MNKNYVKNTVRVVKLSKEDVEGLEKYIEELNDIDAKCMEVGVDCVEIIYDELEVLNSSEGALNFAKQLTYEMPYETTDLMKSIAENTPIEELFSVLDCCDEKPSESTIYQIKNNISDRLKNILKKIVE